MTQCTTQNSQRAAGIKDPFTIISGISTPRTQSPPNLQTPAIMSSAPPKSAHLESVENETLKPNSIPTTQEQEASTFVKAVDMIIKGKDSGSKPKLREPD